MSEEIQQHLRELPKPVLSAEKQTQILHNIEIFESKQTKRKRWTMAMKKAYLGALTIAAVIILSVFTYNQMGERHTTGSRSEVINHNYVDPPGLSAHQVALNDLYVEIPYQKADVNINKRTSDKFVIVDIRNKETGKLLYTYGESIGHDKDKIVFRDVQTKKTKVRIQAFVEIDPAAQLITKVKSTSAIYEPHPDKIRFENIIPGEFPAKSVEVLANINLDWGNDTQHIYEGYVIGVMK